MSINNDKNNAEQENEQEEVLTLPIEGSLTFSDEGKEPGIVIKHQDE